MNTNNLNSAASEAMFPLSGNKENKTKKLVSASAAAAVGLTIAVILAVCKITIGLLAGSAAMVSDGVNSGFDVVCAALASLGVRLSKKRADRKFNYGYARFECLTSIMLSFLLMTAVVIIFKRTVTALVTGSYLTEGAPGQAAVFGTLFAILLKLGLSLYFKYVAYRTGSVAVRSESRHHLADGVASFGALVGILAARHGLLFMDSAASFIACAFIAPTAIRIFLDAAPRLLDRACPAEVIREIESAVGGGETFNLSDIKTRQNGRDTVAELEISVPGVMTVEQGEIIARQLESRVTSLPSVNRCSVKIVAAQK